MTFAKKIALHFKPTFECYHPIFYFSDIVYLKLNEISIPKTNLSNEAIKSLGFLHEKK